MGEVGTGGDRWGQRMSPLLPLLSLSVPTGLVVSSRKRKEWCSDLGTEAEEGPGGATARSSAFIRFWWPYLWRKK